MPSVEHDEDLLEQLARYPEGWVVSRVPFWLRMYQVAFWDDYNPFSIIARNPHMKQLVLVKHASRLPAT